MTPELQSALKRHMQWFGSYKKSGELVKVQVWLIVSKGRVEFLTNKNSYKVRRLSRNPKAISYVGSENGPAVAGTAQIITEKADLARVYRGYWKIHPVFMLLASVITSKAAIHDQFKTGHTLEDVHDIGCSIPPPAAVASLF